MTSKKNILITGANRGIGKEIARQLSALGHVILATARKAELKDEILEPLNSYSRFYPLDVTDSKQIQSLAEQLTHEFPHLDVVINNAGVIGSVPLNVPDIDEIRHIMEVNFYGPLQVNAAFLSLLQKSRAGHIINISSGMGSYHEMMTGYAGYRLSKAGLNAQTQLLAKELRADGISVSAMCPGWVRTDMGGDKAPREVWKGAETAVWLATHEGIPTGRFWRDKTEIRW